MLLCRWSANFASLFVVYYRIEQISRLNLACAVFFKVKLTIISHTDSHCHGPLDDNAFTTRVFSFSNPRGPWRRAGGKRGGVLGADRPVARTARSLSARSQAPVAATLGGGFSLRQWLSERAWESVGWREGGREHTGAGDLSLGWYPRNSRWRLSRAAGALLRPAACLAGEDAEN
jgi:hypothetical protein